MVATAATHVLDHLFTALGTHTTALSYDLAQHKVDLTGHVGRVTTDVEVGLVLEEIADESGLLAQTVLDVDLFRRFTREGRDNFQAIAKLLLVFLSEVSYDNSI